jgi:hypothetical protein
LSQDLAFGLITGGFGLSGVLVGGWLTTHEARRKENREDERRYRTAARLVRDDLHRAELLLSENPTAFPPDLAIEYLTPAHWTEYRDDLLAAVNDGQWLNVSLAFSTIDTMRALVVHRKEWPLTGSRIAMASNFSETVKNGYQSIPGEIPSGLVRRERHYRWSSRRDRLGFLIRHPVRRWQSHQIERRARASLRAKERSKEKERD